MRISKSTIVLLSIAVISISTMAHGADITTGLVGYWPFSGDAQDASGNDNHGTSFGADLTTDRNGNPDSAYNFDGLSSRIDIPSSASLESPTTAITIAAWIRRDGWGMVGDMYSPILTKSTNSTNGFQYRLTASQAGIGTAFNNWNTAHTTPYDLNDAQWYHVASTWEAGTLSCYINGNLQETVSLPATIVPDSRTLSIGSDFPGFLEIFSGDLDEIRIYNRALTAGDIEELVGPLSSVPITFGSGAGLQLGGAFPNPMTLSAALPFTLRDESVVSLDIIDVAGRRVRNLVEARALVQGSHTFHWDGRDAAGRKVVSGTYLYRVSTSQETVSGKILISR